MNQQFLAVIQISVEPGLAIPFAINVVVIDSTFRVFPPTKPEFMRSKVSRFPRLQML